MFSPNLKTLNSSSEEVKALQEKLTTIGLSIPEQELDKFTFGVEGADAVKAFQLKNEFEPTGTIDTPTQRALELAVKAAETSEYKLGGRIYFTDGTPAPGLESITMHLTIV